MNDQDSSEGGKGTVVADVLNSERQAVVPAHTPEPWEIYHHPSDGRATFLHVGKHWAGRNWGTSVFAGDDRVCQTDGLTEAEAEANAELIVKAVNSHDALYAAAKRALNEGRLYVLSIETIRQLVAALALVDGVKETK